MEMDEYETTTIQEAMRKHEVERAMAQLKRELDATKHKYPGPGNDFIQELRRQHEPKTPPDHYGDF